MRALLAAALLLTTAAAPLPVYHEALLDRMQARGWHLEAGVAHLISHVKFFLYEAKFDRDGVLSMWYDELYRILETHPQRTENPEEAELFFPGIDVACCFLWPSYSTFEKDINFIRGDSDRCLNSRYERLHNYLERMPHFKAGKQHIVFDYWGHPQPNPYYHAHKNLLVAAVSFDRTSSVFREGQDLGWPAMPILPLTPPLLHCPTGSTYNITFKGTKDAAVRLELPKIHDPQNGIVIVLTEFKNAIEKNTPLDNEVTKEYASLMTSTDFGLVPRGDSLYSFRFLETLAAGAIPIILSDGWVLPFEEVLDYRAFSLVVKESDVTQIPALVAAISSEKRCAMRQAAVHAYQHHLGSIRAQLDTLLLLIAHRLKLQGL
eukprot:m.364482 g.364482  ORF g.364482 m.364482 type:complete len:376 (-) comp56039_c0_seq2:126-1253(-)